MTESHSNPTKADPRRDTLVLAAILLATAIAYVPVLNCGYVNYDDHRYITANPIVQQGLTIDGVRWAFTSLEVANWHPITWLSHMLDIQVFGLDHPGGHHAVNLLLHLLNTALVFVLLRAITLAPIRSALVAALFALHPLHVESVAWISERKDLLSTCFGLLAMLSYARYARSPSIARYAVIVVCFAMSLMAKPMLVTLPFLLMLLDVWPLKRPDRWLSWIFDKLPLLAISVASSIVTMIAQSRGGAVSSLESVPLAPRIANSIVACATYLRQMLWPLDLGPLYPLPASPWSASIVSMAAAVLLGVSIGTIVMSRTRPAMLIGWLWFLGTLVPVIGLVQVGSASHADRYTYVPLIGAFIMLAWCLPDAAILRSRRLLSIIVTGVLISLMAVTFVQAGYWTDSITLSRRAIAVTDANAIAHFNLANALTADGELDAAIDEFIAAEQINPRIPMIPFNLGNALARDETKLDQAIAAYQRALAVDNNFAPAWMNLGIAHARSHRLDAAAEAMSHAVSLRREDAAGRVNLANVLVQLGRVDDARSQLQAALALVDQSAQPDTAAEIKRRIESLRPVPPPTPVSSPR